MRSDHKIWTFNAIDGVTFGISIEKHLTAWIIVNTKTTPLRFDRSNSKQLLWKSVSYIQNTTDNLLHLNKDVGAWAKYYAHIVYYWIVYNYFQLKESRDINWFPLWTKITNKKIESEKWINIYKHLRKKWIFPFVFDSDFIDYKITIEALLSN